jgi:hypothetical protein
MNSAFLLWGQLLLGCFALAGVVLQVARFGPPNESVRVLGLLLNLCISAILLADGASVFGWFPIFSYPPLYNTFLGILAFALPAFMFLGVLERPTQIQRKVMWRLPLMGAFLGHILLNAVPLFVLGWLSTGMLILWKRHTHLGAVRLFGSQMLLALAYSWALGTGWWWLAWVLFVAWIFGFQRLIEMFLVKNLAREHQPASSTQGATS